MRMSIWNVLHPSWPYVGYMHMQFELLSSSFLTSYLFSHLLSPTNILTFVREIVKCIVRSKDGDSLLCLFVLLSLWRHQDEFLPTVPACAYVLLLFFVTPLLSRFNPFVPAVQRSSEVKKIAKQYGNTFLFSSTDHHVNRIPSSMGISEMECVCSVRKQIVILFVNAKKTSMAVGRSVDSEQISFLVLSQRIRMDLMRRSWAYGRADPGDSYQRRTAANLQHLWWITCFCKCHKWRRRRERIDFRKSKRTERPTASWNHFKHLRHRHRMDGWCRWMHQNASHLMKP